MRPVLSSFARRDSNHAGRRVLRRQQGDDVVGAMERCLLAAARDP
jgi:hypothetical protein